MDSTKQRARLGRYSLVAEIAQGGMGIVYLAQATGLHNFKKLVVVKQLKPELAEDEKFVEMFLDEARLAARLNHRNIVQTIEVDQDGDRYFFVMEYLEGRTLHAVSRLRGEKALSRPAMLWVMCDILAGLHYAHELTDYDGKPLGIVHRDVGPRNVFLTYDGQVKLLDFGVAKSLGRAQETQAGELKGRVPYMAPEHVAESMVDRRADVFSAGVLLREALTGSRVWEGLNEIEILKALLRRNIPPIPADADVPEEARAIIDKAMAPDRDDRYRTAHEMRVDIERYVSRIDKSGAFGKLGEHLSREFADHRVRVRAMIEEHVARAEASPSMRGDLPYLSASMADLPGSSTSPGSHPSRSAGGITPSNPSRSARASASSLPAVPSSPSVSSRGSSASAPSVQLSVAMTPKPSQQARASLEAFTPSGTTEIVIPPPPQGPDILKYVLLALGLVAVALGITAAITASRDPASAAKLDEPLPTYGTGRRPEPYAAAPAASSAETQEEVFEVTVRASPAIAELWIDNVSVGQGPHTAKYRAGSQHVVRASAAGYVTRTEPMTVTAATMVNLVLEREAGAPPPPPFMPRGMTPRGRTTPHASASSELVAVPVPATELAGGDSGRAAEP